MGAPDLIGHLKGMGLTLTAAGDRLLVEPREAITDEIRQLIRENKAQILAALNPTTGNAELDGLIDIVGRHYDTPEDEYQLIRETAAGAIQGALLSFRAMATRHLLFDDEPIPDDRILCRDCSNLTRSGQCLAAQRGTIDAHRGYQPVKNVLHRCHGFEVAA